MSKRKKLYLVENGDWYTMCTTLRMALKKRDSNQDNKLYEFTLTKEIKRGKDDKAPEN